MATSKPAQSTATHAPATTHVTHPVAKHTSPAIPKIAAGDHSRKILVALAAKKVAVVLFWTKGAADDNSVRRAVAAVSTRHRVAVFTIPSEQVGRYPAITTGVQIAISPTVLVIGPNHQYQKLVGYTNAEAIGQAIDLARG